ncbi:MAG: hypothetical protein M0R77_02955 [Gammaproteobacteria bacterium]|nr:hypothetical protein [Gammaproteobacteria bacterium]
MKASVVIGSPFSHPISVYQDLIHFQTKLIETIQLGLDDQTFNSYRVLVSSGNNDDFYKQHHKNVDWTKLEHYSNLLVDCILDSFAIEKEINANRNLITDEISKSILNKSYLNVLDANWLSAQFDSVIAHAIIRFMGKQKYIQLAVHSKRFPELATILIDVIKESNKKAGL